MKNKILNVLSILFGLLLINGGLNKFFNYIPTPENLNPELIKDTQALLEIVWLMPLIATAEIVGGALLIFKKTRALGALIVFPSMVGVLLVHTFVDNSGLIMAIVLWAILLWIIYDNRERYLPIIK
ncbi:MAG: DoxX family membrane protein [Bacteroidetes bacterium]|nr:DoxX family membrane protein [Bacteroidota bacterium]